MQLEIPSLLITDDDCDLRETLGMAFARRGFHTLTAGDGEEALRIVQSTPIHLLLLDMNMPRLTGLETLQRVRRISQRLPCILMSADMDEDLAQRAFQAQAFHVLAKPIRISHLAGLVHRALQHAYGWTGHAADSRE